jgi:hypothetical protein
MRRVAMMVTLILSMATFAKAQDEIFPTYTPTVSDAGAGGPVELGVQFTSDVAGLVTAIRFYKSAANTGTHTGSLWSSGGALLATVTFTNETTSGWQQMSFSPPVSIQANTTYTASYHTTVSHFAADQHFFTAAVNNPPLHALGVSNGVYAYGGGGIFPTGVFNETNYGVDVVFVPGNFKDVFVTDGSYTGNLGGLVGADAICQTEAENDGLPGIYKAWIAVAAQPITIAPSTDFTHLTNIAYRQVDGSLVANNWSDLVSGTTHNTAWLSGTGVDKTSASAWSDVSYSGGTIYAGPTCSDWTTASSTVGGQVNIPSSGYIQLASGSTACSNSNVLLCVEQ